MPLLNIFSKPLSGVVRRIIIYAALTPTHSTEANIEKIDVIIFILREPPNASYTDAPSRTRKTAVVISEKKNENAK